MFYLAVFIFPPSAAPYPWCFDSTTPLKLFLSSSVTSWLLNKFNLVYFMAAFDIADHADFLEI